MIDPRKIHIPFLLALFMLSIGNLKLAAQPLVQIEQPVPGKKFSFYYSKCKKNRKNKDGRQAVIYALKALSVAEKKNHLKKAQGLLKELWSSFGADNLYEIEALNRKISASEIKIDDKINLDLELLKVYKQLAFIQNQYRKLPPDKMDVATQDHPLAGLPDISSEMDTLNLQLSKDLQQGAKHHFLLATELKEEKTWQGQLKRARHLAKVLYYVPQFENANEAYQESKSERDLQNDHRGDF